MNKIKWKKPDGTELETNDAKGTVEYAENAGWKRAGDKQVEDKPGSGDGTLKGFDPETDEPVKKKSKK